MPEEIQIVYKQLKDLVRWPRNPKNHDIPQIQASIRRHGFVLPVVEDAATGQLVAGHGRLEALLDMQRKGEPAPARVRLADNGSWEVPVVCGVSFANEQEAEAYLLADNRLVELGSWDFSALATMLAGFEDLSGTGYTQHDVDRLVEDTTTQRHQGRTPEALYEGFVNATVKQVVLYFAPAEYEGVLLRLQRAAKELGASDHSELLQKLLKEYA